MTRFRGHLIYALGNPASMADPSGLAPVYRCDAKCQSSTTVVDSSGVRDGLAGAELVAYDRGIDERRARCYLGDTGGCGGWGKGFSIVGPKGKNWLVDVLLVGGLGLAMMSPVYDAIGCKQGDKTSCVFAVAGAFGTFGKLGREAEQVLDAADEFNDARKAAKATEAAGGGARFVVDSAGNATLRAQGPNGWLEVSEHAAERMTQRGISIDALDSTLTQQPFQYWHEGVWKMGYYDPLTKIFAGTVDDTVTTVIGKASQNYINNLKAVTPP